MAAAGSAFDGTFILFFGINQKFSDSGVKQAIASVLNRLVREQKTIFVITNEPFIISAAQAVIDLNQKPCPRIVHAQLKEEALA